MSDSLRSLDVCLLRSLPMLRTRRVLLGLIMRVLRLLSLSVIRILIPLLCRRPCSMLMHLYSQSSQYSHTSPSTPHCRYAHYQYHDRPYLSPQSA